MSSTSKLKDRLSKAKEDLSELRNDMADSKQALSELKTQMSKFQEDSVHLAEHLLKIWDDLPDNTSRSSKFKEKVSQAKHRISNFKSSSLKTNFSQDSSPTNSPPGFALRFRGEKLPHRPTGSLTIPKTRNRNFTTETKRSGTETQYSSFRSGKSSVRDPFQGSLVQRKDSRAVPIWDESQFEMEKEVVVKEDWPKWDGSLGVAPDDDIDVWSHPAGFGKTRSSI